MDYDIRQGDFTFKHSTDALPEPNQENFSEHYHTLYELLYFIQGDADFVIQQDRYMLKPHSFLVIKPGEHHNIIIQSNKQYERIVLRFSETDIPHEIRTELGALAHVYNIKGTSLSKEMFRLDKLYEEMDRRRVLLVFRSKLNIILSYLVQSKGLSMQADYVDKNMERIMDYIEENLPAIQTIDDICKNLFLSKSRIQKIFTNQLQTPVMSYVRTQKCILANTLLNQGHPATDVAFQCGFNNYSSFYRAYRRVFGHPPSLT